jgi:hypothetical protein
MSQVGQGAKKVYAGGMQGLKDLSAAMPNYSIAAGLGGTAGTYAIERQEEAEEAMRNRPKESPGMIRPYEFSYGATGVASDPYSGSAERTYFQPTFTALTPYEAPGPEYRKAAAGGLTSLAVGGPIEQMAAMNSVGANTGYPQAGLQTPMYTNPTMQRPQATNVIAPSADAGVDAYTGEIRFAKGGATVDPQSQSSGYEYAYDPKTSQFTQTSGPGAAAPKGYAGFGNLIPSLLAQMPQQASASNTVSGGIATPVIQPTSQAQSFVPNIDIPAYQTPEQQLGLGGFYDYMNSQLGSYAGYAEGGMPSLRPAPMNKKMADVDAARAKMRTRQGQMEMKKAARAGDYSAQLALQDAGYDMNDLNQYASGGISTLGGYSDGGHLLKGPGDGVSDSIPASIGGRQPARLADGEFVVPARIVSEIGNGSTEAGARKLYAMMDRVQNARRKTVGKNQVARNTKAEKLLPA